jgi:hypothetical protein
MCDIDNQTGQEAVSSVTEEYGQDRAIFIKTDVSKLEDMEGQLGTWLNMFPCWFSNCTSGLIPRTRYLHSPIHLHGVVLH